MYAIGQFSTISRLTVKTLHHYDAIGLLKPALVGENNYRYYTEEQLRACYRIEELKKLDFSLEEIKAILSGRVSLAEMLEAQMEKLRERRDYYQRGWEDARLMLRKLEGEREMSSYEVHLQEVEPVQVLSLRQRGPIADIGNTIGRVFEAVYRHGLQPAGPIFARYFQEEFNPEDTEYEVCIPVDREIAIEGEVVSVLLPGGRMLSTVFQGPYSEIGLAYKSLYDYAGENGYQFTGPPREFYLVGPGSDKSPAEYLTQVMMPV